MLYNENLAARIRTAWAHLPAWEEKHKMGGLTFVRHHKICMRVTGHNLLCRIGPAAYEAARSRKGCREWIYKEKPMQG